jgi:hypothetical protein
VKSVVSLMGGIIGNVGPAVRFYNMKRMGHICRLFV